MTITMPMHQPAAVEYEPFRPALQERFLVRFYRAAATLAEQSADEREATIRGEVEWALQEQGNPRQQKLYQAVWLLLRDLLRVGWSPRWDAATGTFAIAPPKPYSKAHNQEEIVRHKQQRREVMAYERHSRLVQARDFIERMERPSRGGASITALLADGPQLAAELQAIAALEQPAERLAALRHAVQPYLQLVEEQARCVHTNLLLSEIWRYVRLTWASPAYNTPGRSLFYLVRDAARPNHPVMGIASLENAPIYIGARDTHLGWSPDAFLQSLTPDADPTQVRVAFQELLDHVQRAVGEIQADGLCTPEELTNPTSAIVQRLKDRAVQFARERQEALRQWKQFKEQPRQEGEVELQRSVYGDVSEEAYELLFLKKRAGELSRLLGTQLALNDLLAQPAFALTWRDWAQSERGKAVIRNALVAIKNQHVGTSILELNICGAVPPYNHLLAGKLTALMICSPQVVADYKRRYGQARSEIASQLKGVDVVRPAELVYIGTTALYTSGSSQYHRLRLPAGLLRSDAPQAPIKCIGKTIGYGTSHISDATTEALERAVDKEFLQVNHVMGEGVSPKMRIIRWGLDVLFREGQRALADRMAQHQMQRLVYGVWLAENGADYLQGRTNQPRYIWDTDMPPQEGSERIAEFWRTRWLDSRLRYPAALQQVAQFDPQQWLLSQQLTSHELDWAYRLMRMKTSAAPASNGKADPALATTSPDAAQRRLVRQLYRGATGFADDVPLEDLKRLHAPTDLDSTIREHIAAKRSVVLTGNPGDGKTHLLRILETELTSLGAVVEPDASAVANETIMANWQAALQEGRPYFIAINESVLFKLAAANRTFLPLQEACRQVSDAISYGPSATPPLSLEHVVALDLSHRNTLDAQLVARVIDTLTADAMLPRCAHCPQDGCDMVRNQYLLRQTLVRERLQQIFDSISRRGIHVTMRDLQAFIAFLIFADRDCQHLALHSHEAQFALPQLPYLGQGPLFDAVRLAFDPAQVCHPIYDDHLINNTLPKDEWLLPEYAEAGSIDVTAQQSFAQRKRLFYFCHQRGAILLDLMGDDEQEFAKFLLQDPEASNNPLRSAMRKLTAFFGHMADSDKLPVWQSHRYDQSAQRILYASQVRQRREFSLHSPRLTPHMAHAFRLADDHRILQLKSEPKARLRIDYTLFRLLHQAERGLPALLLQPEAARRIWQFLEQLTDEFQEDHEEVKVRVLDPMTGEQIVVTVDHIEEIYPVVQIRKGVIFDTSFFRSMS